MQKTLSPQPRSTIVKWWFLKVNRFQVCQQQVQNVRNAETILHPGGSGSSGLQTSPKPASWNVQNAGSPGENTTEIRLFFNTTFENHISRKNELSGQSSFLPQAEPEALWFPDQDLYSYREFESNDFSRFQIAVYPDSESFLLKYTESSRIFKGIYLKGN